MKEKLIHKSRENVQQYAAAHAALFSERKRGFYLKDNRESAAIQRKQIERMQRPPVQRKPNTTGLPDTLKSGIENLSGHSLDDVKVHYNSPKPAQLNAHAYAQGTDIHVASGQEKHIPHEAWHIVQQKQGRVQPTTTVNGAKINDNVSLEKEADIMSAKALQRKVTPVRPSNNSYRVNVIQRQAVIQRLKRHAKRFIKANHLGILSTKIAVEAYVNDTNNDKELRRGLLKAWNKTDPRKKHKRSSVTFIKTPADLERTGTNFMQKDDLHDWDSGDEDNLDIGKVIKKKKIHYVDLERSKGVKNRVDVPQLDLFDAIRIGRQINKQGEYQHVPYIVDI
ncbi:MAG: DUF4157 domain-containing protein, partial [Bacteroidota bacterium]